MEKGWVRIHRRLLGDDLWKKEPFSRGQAWVDLLLLANWKDGFIRVGGQRIPLKRGQCGWSVMSLATRWKWSRSKVIRFVSELEMDGELNVETNNRTTVLTICKYSQYQDDDTTDDTADRTTDEHQTNIKRTLIKKDNKDKKEKNTSVGVKNMTFDIGGALYDFNMFFEKFWNYYPKIRDKGHKGKAKEQFERELTKGGTNEETNRIANDIAAGVRRYAKYCSRTGEKNPDAFRWLRDEGFKRPYDTQEPDAGSNGRYSLEAVHAKAVADATGRGPAGLDQRLKALGIGTDTGNT